MKREYDYFEIKFINVNRTDVYGVSHITTPKRYLLNFRRVGIIKHIGDNLYKALPSNRKIKKQIFNSPEMALDYIKLNSSSTVKKQY